MTIEIADRITADSAVRFGKPVIKGTRVPVSVVVGQAAAGKRHEEIAGEYGVSVEDVRAALRYAHAVLDQETVGILAKT
jgi:uncharacterized protein (DUF433 family)